jgi:ABC-type transport system involved in multi-copper enzyme maturation permease subunit
VIDLLGQTFTTTTSETRFNAGFIVFALFLQIVFAMIPAWLASRKGHSFGLFWLFGFLCWLPAIITAAVISPKVSPVQYYGRQQYNTGPSWQSAPPQPAGPPPGWYPDPQQDGRQRYWDGTRWTEHTSP